MPDYLDEDRCGVMIGDLDSDVLNSDHYRKIVTIEAGSLGDVWRRMNVVDGSPMELPNKLGCRSMCVGDVVKEETDDGRLVGLHYCAGVGWQRIRLCITLDDFGGVMERSFDELSMTYRSQKAKEAFNRITGASYYGLSFVVTVANDETSYKAAVALADRLHEKGLMGAE